MRRRKRRLPSSGDPPSSPFCTLSHSRKISSPPRTEPHVLSILEIFRLEALGDSVGHVGREQGSRDLRRAL